MIVKELIVELKKLIPEQEILIARYPHAHPVAISSIHAETKWFLPGATLPDGSKNKSDGYDELQFTLLLGHEEGSVNINWDEYGQGIST